MVEKEIIVKAKDMSDELEKDAKNSNRSVPMR